MKRWAAVVGILGIALALSRSSHSQVSGGPVSGTLPSVVVGSPTGGNEGAGSINAQSIYINGVAVVGGGVAPPIPLSDLATQSPGTTLSVLCSAGSAASPSALGYLYVCGGTPTLTGPLPANYSSDIFLTTDAASYGTSVATVGFSVQDNVGGTGANGNKIAFMASARQTAASANNGYVVGGWLWSEATLGLGGTLPGSGIGKYVGANPQARADTGATGLQIIEAAEADISTQTGSSADYKFGVAAVLAGDDAAHATTDESAFAVWNGGTGGWQNAFEVTNFGGNAPLTTSGTILRSHGTATVGSFIDFSSYTCSGYEINFVNYQLDCNGNVLSSPNGPIGNVINIASASYGANGDMIVASRTVSITSSSSTLTVTGASFSSADVGKMISVPGAGVTPTITGVAISGTGGQFTCTCANVAVGQTVTISGTFGGTGSITGYTNPTNYYVSVTNGTSTFTLQTQAQTAIVTTAGTPSGLTYSERAKTLITTIAGYTSATVVTLTAAASTTLSSSTQVIAYGTDNATAIGNAITAAVSAGKRLYIPSAGSKCYGYTAPLTVAGNLTIEGDYSWENWGTNTGANYNQANVPTAVPQILGSVLCPSSNGSDAIDITGLAPVVNIKEIGILFQSPLFNTGHGISTNPGASSNQSLSGSQWYNLKVYGHDGNHYGFYVTNPWYDDFYSLHSYGGGGFYLYSNERNGNTAFYSPYGQTFVGGSAHGFNLGAVSNSEPLQIATFIRPQEFVQNLTGITPAGNPPVSTQYTWQMDGNESYVRVLNPDMETNVSSPTNFYLNNTNAYDLIAGATTSTPAAVNGGPSYMTAQNGGSGNTNGGSIVLLPGTGSGSGANGAVSITAQGSTGYTDLQLNSNASTAGQGAAVQFYDFGTLLFNLGTYQTTPNQFFLYDQSGCGNVYQADANTDLKIMQNGTCPVAVGGATAAQGGSLTAKTVGTTGYAIASLPTCNGTSEGQTAYVTNGQATPTYLGTVSTTGTTVAPVFCNGSNWIYH